MLGPVDNYGAMCLDRKLVIGIKTKDIECPGRNMIVFCPVC